MLKATPLFRHPGPQVEQIRICWQPRTEGIIPALVPVASRLGGRKSACTYLLKGMHPSELMGAVIRVCSDGPVRRGDETFRGDDGETAQASPQSKGGLLAISCGY